MLPEKTKNGPILSQSLFSTVRAPANTWRSHVTSTFAHSLLILALLFITIPVIQHEAKRHRVDEVTLIAPQLPDYQLRVPPSPTPVPAKSAVPVIHRPNFKPRSVPVMKPVLTRPTPAEPTPIEPPVIAAAPEIKKQTPPVATVAILEKPPAPPISKAEVRTGSFQSASAALAPQKPRLLKVGAFGDPNGSVPADHSRQSAVEMARLGSFDSPEGSGQSGGGGKTLAGSVRQTSFGNGGEANSPAQPQPAAGGSRNPASIHTGAFGETPSASAQTASNNSPAPKPVIPAVTPVEILSKPKPTYTAEARTLKLEGQVSLEVVFQSNGSLRILRVVKGLGHGLDEAAEHAALQVRFRPATRAGVPVDSNATIHITFQLT